MSVYPKYRVAAVQAARDNDIYVCIGSSEKDEGSLYLTRWWFDNKGNLMGKHRKMRVSVSGAAPKCDSEAPCAPIWVLVWAPAPIAGESKRVSVRRMLQSVCVVVQTRRRGGACRLR